MSDRGEGGHETIVGVVERLRDLPPVLEVVATDAVELVLDRDTILWTIFMLGGPWMDADPDRVLIKRLRVQLAELRVNPGALDLEV